MILYFDNYITDTPIHKGIYGSLGTLRTCGVKIYEMPSKLDITLYELESYAVIEWSHVIIKYELENMKQKKEFETRVKKLFPKAIILYGRSDSQKKFKESIQLMESMDDEWIFYAGNNDHPFMSPNTKLLKACLKKAKEVKKNNKWVSIATSHHPEFYNAAHYGSPFHELRYTNVKKFSEDKHCIVANFPKGLMHSMQIVHKDLFKHWFLSGNAYDKLIRRSEDMEPYVTTKNQKVIIPKGEICAHFDGELVSDHGPLNIPHSLAPPLFIPPGFFEKEVKIRYGYDDYKEGWVNINPIKDNFSFEDKKNGTDLKIALDAIPLFWRDKIKTIDRNKKVNQKRLEQGIQMQQYKLKNPHPKKSKLFYMYYRTKGKLQRSIYRVPFLRAVVLQLMHRFPWFKKGYKNLNHIHYN